MYYKNAYTNGVCIILFSKSITYRFVFYSLSQINWPLKNLPKLINTQHTSTHIEHEPERKVRNVLPQSTLVLVGLNAMAGMWGDLKFEFELKL